MWQKNLEALQKQYPSIYTQLLEVEPSGVFDYVNDEATLSQIKYKGKYVHSKYNPVLEAKRWVDSLQIDATYDCVFVYGLGLGYYLEDIKAKYADKKIIVVEPHLEVFKYCLMSQDMTPYLEDDYVVFMVAFDAVEVRSLLEYYIEESKIKRVFFAELPFYKKHFSEYIEGAYEQISRTLQLFKANIYTEIYSSRRWLFNFFSNIKYFEETPNIIAMKDVFKGKPVVIVAAGPSLNKNVHLLRNLYDKALIIAVGTAALILDKKGIQPHIVMGADGNYHESLIFKEITCHKPLFIYSQMIQYKSLEYYKGRKMWVHLNSDELETQFLKAHGIEVPVITCGGSIAHNALAFARWLEAGPVMLLGQDLAFSNEKMYADGGNDDALDVNMGFVDTVDIFGKPIRTNKVFLTYRNWFEDFVSLVYKEHNIVNCTEGGLPIKGIENERFELAIDKFCKETFDYEAQLVTCHAAPEARFKLPEGEIESLKDALETCLELAKTRFERMVEWLECPELDSACAKDIQSEVMRLTEALEEMDFYKTFIVNTGRLFHEALTREVNQKVKELKADAERREAVIRGLYTQYLFALENLRIAQAAFEGIEPANLF